MMKMFKVKFKSIVISFFIGTALLLFFASFYNQPVVKPKEVLYKMFASIDHINSLTFKLKKRERVDGKLMFGEQDVKFIRQPKKIYTKILAPNSGVELLYIDGKNDNKAYLNPNGFPYTNLSFSPYSSTLRKGNHHTIHEVGFDYIKAIIENIATKSEKNFDQIFVLEGKVMFDNKWCYKINIDNNTYKQENYIVKKGETLTSIAYKLLLSDYKLLLMNPSIKDYDDVEEGQEIKITTSYAPKTTLYIDAVNFLPLVQIISDEKGIFEQYEFHNLKLDPFIHPDEFTKDYEGYHF